MYTNTRFRGFGAIVVLATAMIGLQAPAALTNNVPLTWNVSTISNGAYLEGFEGATLPDWATGTLVTNTPPGPFPARSNTWFSSHVSVLQLDGSVAVTNSFTNAVGFVSFATNAVFVDLRIQFTPMSDVPASDALALSKLALFVNATSNLVAAVSGGTWTTNAATMDLTLWYQVTVKMHAGTFDVLTNDAIAFSGLTLNNSVDPNLLKSLSISGAASLDDLYVSMGNPAYPGTLGSVPRTVINFPGTGGASVTNWLANYFNDGRLAGNANFTGISSAQIDAAYLLNQQLGGSPTSPSAVPYTFGISSINMSSPTQVSVVCALAVNGAGLNGTITGKVQLQGKQNWTDGWTVVGSPVAPTFTGGSATCTFTVPSGYQFFHPQIVP